MSGANGREEKAVADHDAERNKTYKNERQRSTGSTKRTYFGPISGIKGYLRRQRGSQRTAGVPSHC